jgi:hypothetical protein
MNYQASSSQNDFHSAIAPEQFNRKKLLLMDGILGLVC